MWSPLRKALGLGDAGYLGEWHAFRQYFRRRRPGRPADRLCVWFEPDLLPGYAWSFPLPDGRANVGFGIQRDGERDGAGHEGAVARAARPAAHRASALGPDAEPEAPHKAWPIPARIDQAVARARAGRCSSATRPRPRDPMTGEGIGQALLTGRLAARGDRRRRRRPTRRGRGALRARRPPTSSLADHRMSAAARHGRSRTAAGARGAVADRRRSATGPGATSPAGCSRTSPAPIAAHPAPLAPPGLFTARAPTPTGRDGHRSLPCRACAPD